MKENNKINKFGKLVVFAVFVVMITMSAAQGVVQQKATNTNKLNEINDIIPDLPPAQPLDDPYFTWEDNFDTAEFIDPDTTLSNNYELVNGIVQIKNTYEIWTDPAWEKMKPIEITNSGGESLPNYAILLTVDYDPDMDPNYADIRFKHEDFPTSWLDYWIESIGANSACVWVKVPIIPTGTSMMYLFYDNPNAQSQSDFYSVFTQWGEEWANDEKISTHASIQGAWDPDVCFGNGEFIVAWEQGQFYYPPWTWGFKQSIVATIYDSDDGDKLVDQHLVFNDGTTYYRNENPSIDYGGSKFFVAWEHYDTVANPSVETMDIKARSVQRSGSGFTLGSVIDVCAATSCQADANVQFDSVNNRFCVVWEDARNGWSNYNVYGRLYDTSGNPVGSEKGICTAANSQTEPWVAFDSIHEQYMIVWEEGITANNGPFSIKAGIFDENLNQIGSTITIATGNDDTDYNFPCVEFCADTQRFLVTWNDGDISDGDWWGNVWGKIFDTSGNVAVDTFLIKSGNFVRTDIVLYLSSSFFVSFDNNGNIWGKLISSEGSVFVGDVQLSASSSAVADWANMGVGNGKIFVAWEDTRVIYPSPWNDMPDSYGNIWNLNIPSGSEVTVVFGTEKQLILTAQLTSKEIDPDNLVSWYEFYVTFDGSIVFNILDSDGTTVLIPAASNGEDLGDLDPVGIRLQGCLTRTNPSYSPTLDMWKVIYVGLDEDPPETVISDIIGELGLNEWYIGNVKIILSATDGQQGSGVNHTYFKIDDGEIIEYDNAYGIKLPQDATGDPNTLYGSWGVWYWSVDKAENVETPQGPVNIKIDKVSPYCDIWDPADRSNVPRHGGFWVQATAVDNGSGIHYVSFDVGPPYENPVVVYNDDPPGSGNFKWWCDRTSSSDQWRHIIAQAYDYAGHMYESNIYVYFKNVLIQGSVQNNVDYLINSNIQIDSNVLLNQQLNGMQNNLIFSRVQLQQT